MGDPGTPPGPPEGVQPPVTPPEGSASPEPDVPAPPVGATWWRIGWAKAIVGAIIAAVAAGALAQVVVFIAYASSNSPPSVGTTAGIGGILFYEFHHVAIAFTIPSPLLGPSGFGGEVSASFGLAILGGTLLVAWILAWAGRRCGNEAGGSVLNRALAGAKVAVPYAVIAWGFSFLVKVDVPIRPGLKVPIQPSQLGAFFWPFWIALVVGALGGLASAAMPSWERSRWGTRIRGAIWGGLTMLGAGLTFAFLSLLGMAVAMPSATSNYFDGVFHQGVWSGIDLILLNVLAIPNMAAWVMFPSMGACIGASGNVAGFSLSYCVLSYQHFPASNSLGGASFAGGVPSINLPHPPFAYYLYILGPILAVLLGGVIATRRSSARTRGEAASSGALAGLVFGAASLAVALLAVIDAHVSGRLATVSGSGSASVGPNVVQAVLLSLLWGVVGGTLGALFAGRHLPSRLQPMTPGPGPVQAAPAVVASTWGAPPSEAPPPATPPPATPPPATPPPATPPPETPEGPNTPG